LDSAEPPRIVFENPAKCTDGAHAEDVLRRALGAPRERVAGWTVALKIERTGARAVRAAGEIVDSRGAPVANRVLLGTGPDCGALAQAMGVWASLVLDAEAQRPHTAAAETQPPSSPVATPAAAGEGDAAGNATQALPWPAPEPAEKASPEHDWYLHHEKTSRALEVGVSGFLMTGTGGGAMAGPSPFLFVEVGHGIFLRPSLEFGQTITSLPPGKVSGTWVNSRLDTCLRLPGLYSNHSGMQLNVCGGADVGLTLIDNGVSLPFVALGPSADLRGELGSNLAVALRFVGGLNLLQQSFVEKTTDIAVPEQVPAWSGRIELAFSWSLR
jgi:hypothetical protein